MDDTGDLAISDATWMAEVDALRPVRDSRSAVFTPEIDRFLLYSRATKPPLPWPQICEIARKFGWPSSQNTLRGRLRELQGSGAESSK